MYPNLYYLFKDLFGISLPALAVFNTSGLFIALSIVVAAWCWKKDIKRKQASGELVYMEKQVITGAPPGIAELVSSFLLGFLFGYKIIAIFFSAYAQARPQAFLFSLDGNWYAGIITGVVSVAYRWMIKKQQQLPEPKTEMVKDWPADWVTGAAVAAAIAGVAGCKIFYILENRSQFAANPTAVLLSPSGFTYYGGLVLATITMWLYHYRWGKYRMRIADAMAPSLMLGYAVGRSGCQLSGDGDWGIPNIHPKPFTWLPDWLWAYDYPHNTISKGLFIPGCDWDIYCYHLGTPVYPTPVYEIILALLIFVFMWSIRKRFTVAGKISAVYLALNGIERFFIELIRVNPRYNFLGVMLTDSQVMAIVYVIAGILLWVLCPKLRINKELKQPA